MKIDAPKLSKDQSAPINVQGAPQTRLVNAIGRPMAGGAPALQSGDDLNIQISLPVEPLFWGFLGFVVLLLAAVPITIFTRRGARVDVSTLTHQAQSKIAEPSDASFVSMQPPAQFDVPFDARAQNLIEQIARLDDEMERGQMSAEAYRSQRATWKQELVEQLLQSPRAQL